MRFLPGHTADHRPAHAWNLDAFAGAGAIRSKTTDMLIYLDANLDPEGVKPVVASAAPKTISKALIQDHDLGADSIGEVRRLLSRGFATRPRKRTGTTAPPTDIAGMLLLI